MNRIVMLKNIIIILIFTRAFSSCIEPFAPNLENKNVPKYVVYGQVTDQGYATVSVSMTSTLEKPEYNAVRNCDVTISDDHNNTFTLWEGGAGNFGTFIPNEYLNPGSSFRVNVTTSNGVQIVSDFDIMPEGAEIDSIYYIRKDIETAVSGKPLQGIQFYVDVDGKSTDSHYYMWDIIETWEHHASYPKSYHWNGKTIDRINPTDHSKMVCWTTQRVPNIYTLSTENLTQNRFFKHQLLFVDNNSQRLTYCYSLWVNQYALSKSAYNYWDNLRINGSEQGGLYNIQPLQIKGNLNCISNPDLEILGYFGASSIRTERIFVRNVKDLDLCYPECYHEPIDLRGLWGQPPCYLILVDGGVEIVDRKCVECDAIDGTNVKPYYWPN